MTEEKPSAVFQRRVQAAAKAAISKLIDEAGWEAFAEPLEQVALTYFKSLKQSVYFDNGRISLELLDDDQEVVSWHSPKLSKIIPEPFYDDCFRSGLGQVEALRAACDAVEARFVKLHGMSLEEARAKRELLKLAQSKSQESQNAS